jgi:hypothetical protein
VESFEIFSIESINIFTIGNWLEIAGLFFTFFCLNTKETKSQGTRRPPYSFLRHFLTLNWETKKLPLVGQLLFLIQFNIKKHLK